MTKEAVKAGFYETEYGKYPIKCYRWRKPLRTIQSVMQSA